MKNMAKNMAKNIGSTKEFSQKSSRNLRKIQFNKRSRLDRISHHLNRHARHQNVPTIIKISEFKNGEIYTRKKNLY